MKKCWPTTLFLILCFPSVLLSFPQATCAADQRERIFLEFGRSAESLDATMPDVARLGLPAPYDPFTVGSLALGVKPWLDLLDKSSYSLKLSLPVSRGPVFYGWQEEGSNFLSAGFLASMRLKSLPARYGSWTVSTGLFLIRRDHNLLEQPTHFGDLENTGGIGTVNISITY